MSSDIPSPPTGTAAERSSTGNLAAEAGPAGSPVPSESLSAVDRRQEWRLNGLDKRAERREFVTLAVAILGVAIAAASVWISHQQWQVMREQLQDARAAAEEAAKDSRAAADRSQRMVDAMARQAAASQQSAAAASEMLKAAQISIASERESLQLTQRAFLHVGLPSINLETGIVSLPIENSGRMPAPRIIAGSADLRRFLRSSETLSEVYRVVRPFGGDRTAIPPGGGYYGLSIASSDTRVFPRGLAEGRESLMVAGSLEYDFGFGRTDKGSFCYMYGVEGPSVWSACPIVTFADLQKLK